MKHIILVGNPNSGKTTLFNALTASSQQVGNWPGVTVEKKVGRLTSDSNQELTDLPGIYALSSPLSGSSQDEQISAKAIIDLDYDLIINVVDACALERHLYLTSQLLEIGKPVILALNMMDRAAENGIHINIEALSERLGCTVIPLQAHKEKGLSSLIKAIQIPQKKASPFALTLAPSLRESLNKLMQTLEQSRLISPTLIPYYAYRLAESGHVQTLPKQIGESVASALEDNLIEDTDVLMADARYQYLHHLVQGVSTKTAEVSERFTAKLDKILLHRFFALPLFFSIMYAMFLFAINLGGVFQPFFDLSSNALFVQGTTLLLETLHAPTWLVAVIANGIGKGINTTITFVPVLAAMYFFLSFLEASGYMARAAFIMDRLMRMLGLPGKSFVPMIVGFGCNVPAILAARTLNSERDRLLTIMMTPFMSCSARLAIYAVFVAAFFPSRGQDIIFSLYLIGIGMAVLTGFILRKTLLTGETSPLLLELPAYHKPMMKRLLKDTSFRLGIFLKRASKIIIPVCMILGILNTLSLSGENSNALGSDSVLAYVGKSLTVFFRPMGLEENNWPATVGLLTGLLAKEVVVGSLNALYSQDISHLHYVSLTLQDVWQTLGEAVWTIPENLGHLVDVLIHPISTLRASAESDAAQSVYGEMLSRFDGKIGAYAYLLFILLYVPCVSTAAVIRSEINRRFMWFSVIWSMVLAYGVAVLFYQIATIMTHPVQTLLWVFGLGLFFYCLIYIVSRRGVMSGEHYAT